MFVLDTDTSNHVIGTILSQVQDGGERVVCYGRYVLTPEQRWYCVTRNELLAVVRPDGWKNLVSLTWRLYIELELNTGMLMECPGFLMMFIFAIVTKLDQN